MRILFGLMLLGASSATWAQAVLPPFSISITAEKSFVKAGSDVLIKIHLTNSSKRDLDASANISGLTGVDPNYLYDVRDSGGNLVPKRVYEHPELATGHAVFRTVKAGESITNVQNLSRLYDISQPGKYVIQVRRGVPGKAKDGAVESNKITLTITP